MLIALGLRALRQAREAGRASPFTDRDATRPGEMAASEVGHLVWSRGALRPLGIGLVHGLAGSGALTAAVASKYPSALGGMLFIVLYGLGATLGMALIAGTFGQPLARAMRTRRGPRLLLGAAGTFSLVLGVVWGWPVVCAMALR
jgi:cytochrome c biogenesis protein CcdA